MQRTYRVPLARVGMVALTVIAVLLAHPGTSIAGGTSESTGGTATGDTVLERGSGYSSAGEREAVRGLQAALRKLGWRPGRVDGLFGPRTEAAVTRMQSATGLTPDGIVGAQTGRALRQLGAGKLRRGAGYADANGSQRVRRLQRELRQRGLRPGPVDGRFGPRTEQAVARFEHAVGRPADGFVDRATGNLLAQTPELPAQAEARSGRPDRTTPRAPQGSRVSAPAVSPAAEAPDGVALGALVVGAALTLLVGVLAGALLARTRLAATYAAAPAAPVSMPATVERSTRREAKDPPDVPADGMLVLGYASVDESAEDEASRLREQAAEVDSLCEQHGWRLVQVVYDRANGSGKALGRPGLQYALETIEGGEASCLVVPRLAQLSRSVPDLGRVIDAVEAAGGRLFVADVGLDTATSHGRLAAGTLLSIAEWEHRRLGERTRKGLAAAKARGATTGRAAVGDVPELKERIVAMRSEGMTLQAIADELNAAGVPTIRGGKKWRPSSVQAAAGYRRPRRPKGGGR
jgi:DNA invertase Pin-like site-specific DNA recombinase/peptidoglycan hydrolase-like protein with peptidoglycan-binding domain